MSLVERRWPSPFPLINTSDFPQTWDMFQNRRMFDARDINKENSNLHHIAEMVGLLGPPPKHFLERSEYSSSFLDQNGQLRHRCRHPYFSFGFITFTNFMSGQWKGEIEIPSISLGESEENLDGRDKTLFLQFMRKNVAMDARREVIS